MAVMLEKLYDALRAANVSEQQAHDAAIEGAQYENRAAKMESDLILLNRLSPRGARAVWWNGANSENPERNDACRTANRKGCRCLAPISLP
jgi:hypothetical protein